MSDPVVLQLRQTLAAQGANALQDRVQLEQALANVAASFPGKVKALFILLDKKAVSFLTGWAKDARPERASYEQLRQQVATKFEEAKLLNAAAASWALDAWAEALGLREGAAAPVAPTQSPAAAAPSQPAAPQGLALVEQPPSPKPPEAAVADAATAASIAAAAPAVAAAHAAKTNVYAPPASHVEDPDEGGDEGNFIEGGRIVPAGRGWGWIADAWGLFKESPVIWIVNFVLLVVIMIAVQLVPLAGGLIATLIAPVLGAGLVLGAQAVEQGDELHVGHLFAGFKERTGPLMTVGALYLLGSIVIAVVVIAIVGVSVFGGRGTSGTVFGTGLVLGVLAALALAVPLLMAYWFAPALVVLNGYGAVTAMKMSFSASLKNVVPFFVYGLVAMVLAVPATLLVLLGWFVLGPILAVSLYTSYRDIFYER